MKYFPSLFVAAISVIVAGAAEAGGSVGGSFGSYGGSSGGYAAAYGSHGSSGGYASAYGSSGGSYGSYGSSGGYTAAYGSHGGYDRHHVGPLKRLFARMHARKAARHNASVGGSSGGYVSSYGSSGGSSGGASYGSSGGSSGGAVSYGVPMVSRGINSRAYESGVVSRRVVRRVPLARASRTPAIDEDAALLTVQVPVESAEVTVNGHETTSEGLVRQFMSRGLKEGFVYSYDVNVEYEQDGEAQSLSRTVKLRPGSSERVNFAEPAEAIAESPAAEEDNEPLETVVKVHVPEDAEVSLAGTKVGGEGETRIFRTQRLQPGQEWTDYVVRVTASVNGQKISKERIVNVAAGTTTDLTFEFDNNEVAKR